MLLELMGVGFAFSLLPGFPWRYFCYVAIGEEIRVWLEEHVGFVCSLDNLLVIYSLIIINENLSLQLCPSLSLCIA